MQTLRVTRSVGSASETMRRRKFLAMLAGTALSACVSNTTLPEAPRTTPTTAPQTTASDLWVIDVDRLSPGEQTLIITLQGLVNSQSPRIWISGNGMNGLLLDQLRQGGTTVHEVNTAWELLRQFASEVKGAVVCKLATSSLNVATSVCGLHQAVAIDESILDQARSVGLRVLFDARSYDERKAYNEFGYQFAHGIVVEQTIEKNAHLRDYAVQQKAFTYFGLDPGTTTQIIRERGPDTLVYGWGGDEHNWVQTLSQGGGMGIAADWSRNLSALSKLHVPISTFPRRYPAPVQDGQRIVAFVMSDGDNIQWMGGGFVTDKGFWANPGRGTFNMTWEMAPVFAEVAPTVLNVFYDTASRGEFLDGFVTGPSGAGYVYHNYLPNRAAFAARTAQMLHESGMSVVSVLNSGGSMAQTAELLDRPEVLGVLYKDYAPYNLEHGAIYWHSGKPSISYRWLLWEPLSQNSPAGVAQAVEQMPARPTADQGSYAIINVHAWSWKEIGGPMEAIKRTISQLPPGTRVVTAEQLIILLRNNFGTRVPQS